MFVQKTEKQIENVRKILKDNHCKTFVSSSIFDIEN